MGRENLASDFASEVAGSESGESTLNSEAIDRLKQAKKQSCWKAGRVRLPMS